VRMKTKLAAPFAALLLLLAPAAAPAQGSAPPADKPKAPPRLEATDLTELKKIATACFKAKNGERADLLAQVAKIDAEHAIGKTDIDACVRTLTVLSKQGFRLEGKAGKGAHPDYPAADFIMQAHGAAGAPKLPLFVSLHGKGGTPGGAPVVSMKGPHVVIAPGLIDQAEHWNTEREEQWVLELVETAKRTWDIDTNRVYITGFSMGGWGAWSIGCFHADRFAGIAPSAGGLMPEPILANLKNTPVWISHGAKDTLEPPTRDRASEKQLAELKEKYGPYDYVYKEHPNAGHEYPDCPQACQWMATKVRNPYGLPRAPEPALLAQGRRRQGGRAHRGEGREGEQDHRRGGAGRAGDPPEREDGDRARQGDRRGEGREGGLPRCRAVQPGGPPGLLRGGARPGDVLLRADPAAVSRRPPRASAPSRFV